MSVGVCVYAVDSMHPGDRGRVLADMKQTVLSWHGIGDLECGLLPPTAERDFSADALHNRKFWRCYASQLAKVMADPFSDG